MEIRIRESTMVCPAGDTPRGSLWVSNIDLVRTRYHLPTVYFYKDPNSNSNSSSNGSSNDLSNSFDVKVLKDALNQILVPFYPVAGRLQYDGNGRLEIMCNGEGVLFVEAESTCSIDDIIGDFTDNSLIPQLVPTVDYSGGISSYPLAAYQVTTFKCGGISLGTAVQHTLADGQSSLHFINSWADTARGCSPKVAPFLDRTLLRARAPPTPTFPHIEFEPSPPLNNHNPVSTPASIVSVFKITTHQLNSLKAKVSQENTKYSTYCILTAHIWRCATKARALMNNQPIKLLIPIDGRRRLNPPLPPGYYGNAIFLGTICAQAGEIQSEPFTDTMKKVHETLNEINDEYLRSAIDYIEGIDEFETSSAIETADKFACPNLVINSWVWLPIHDADFGWGRPVYMRPANVVQEGKVYILPTPTNDGSLSVVTRLNTPYMKLFGELLGQL